MAETLTPDAAGSAAPGPQNVAITDGEAKTQIQAPNKGQIWFAFEIGSGNAALNVNFNGQNFPNVQPGQYTLGGLTTPLNLDLKVDGSAKLAWVPL